MHQNRRSPFSAALLCVAALAASPLAAVPAASLCNTAPATPAGFLAAIGAPAAPASPVLPELGKPKPASLCNNFCRAAHTACQQECAQPGCGGISVFSCDNVTCDDVCTCVNPAC